MKMYHYAAMAMLAWPAALPAPAWAAVNAVHDSIVLDNNIAMTNTLSWEAPDVPHVRLPASAPAPAQHWSLPATQRGTAAALPAAQAQPARPIPPVPETSMYSMLLVGLGLLALCMRGEKQEKFDQGR